MKLAIHNWMRAETIETTLKRISSMGYHYIEIQGEPSMYNTEEVNSLLNKYNIDCYGSVTIMSPDRNLLAKDPVKRKYSVEYLKSLVDMVHGFNGKSVSIVPSTVGKILPEGRPDEDWKRAVDSMKEIYEHAENKGISLGIEPINRFETYFINRADQALELAEAVGPNCGVCLDVFHMNMEEDDIYEAFRRSKDRLVNVHVADNNRMAPGMGHFDWVKIRQVLKEINYDRILSVEFCAPVDRTPANPYPNIIDENPKGLSEKARKYLEDHGSSSLSEEFYTMLTKKSADTILPLL